MTFTLHFRLFLYLVLGFILATIVGAVTHELGHIAVAKMQGYKTELHYGSMNYTGEKHKQLETYYDTHKKQIMTADTTEGKVFRKMLNKVEHESFLIRLGGPIQTMLTGTLGFILLWINRRKISYRLSAWQWTFVFLAFFWSRQVAIFFQKITFRLFSIKTKMTGDEERIAHHLDINEWLPISAWAFLGTLVLIIVTFIYIPKQQRFTFVCAGVTGSAIGFILWMDVLGPVILP